MGYLNFPPNLKDLFDDIQTRLRKLETAQRFTAPNVATDPTNPRKGDIWLNTTSNAVNYIDGTGAVQTFTPPPYVAGKNAIINGGMDIWQRGTSVAIAASSGITYTADRWCTTTGTGQAITVSQQATADTTNLPNIQYCTRYQRNSGQTGTGQLFFAQSLETVNSIPLAGKPVSISFYIRAGANFSATGNYLYSRLVFGTGTSQNGLIPGLTGATQIVGINVTATTTWQRVTATAVVPSTATQLYFDINYVPTGTAGANDYFEITGVQLELGSTATTFSRAGGSIGGELALCQRYYWRQNAGTTGYGIYGWGTCSASTTFQPVMKFPVTMRTVPTALDYTNLATGDGVTITGTSTAGLLSNSTPDMAYLNIVVTGLTQFKFYYLLANNSTSSYIAVSAEL